MADEPIPWLVENLLISGGCSILVSKPKTGKTTFTRSLILAVSKGSSFLNRSSQQSTVLIVTMEDKISEVARHFRSMGALGTESILLLDGVAPSVSQLRELIVRNAIGLVIIDTLILGVKGLADINDYVITSRALAPFVQLSRELNCHIMFTHHLGKIERGGGDGILGSTALFASVDAVLLLDRTKSHRTFRTITRYGRDLEPSVITMKDDGSLEIDSSQPSLREPIENELLRYLKSQLRPVTEKTIEAQVFGRTSEKRRVLREMIVAGTIIRSGKGTRTAPFEYSSPHIKEQASGTD